MPLTRNLRDSTVKLIDGTQPTPNELVLFLEEGDLSWTETRNITEILDRGRLSHFREGDEVPCSVEFTLKFSELIKQEGAADPTPYEILNHIGGAATWISSSDQSDICSDIFTVTLEFRVQAPCRSDADEIIQFPLFYTREIEFSEGEEYNTLSVSGTAFVRRPTATKASS